MRGKLKEQLRRSRRRYRRKPTNEHLRWYLKAKGRLGIFDTRMCAYNGVDPNVTPGCRRYIARGYGRGLVPTSTTGGQHAPGSYHGRRDVHGRGQAVDLGLRREEIGTAKGLRRMRNYQLAEYRAWIRGRRANLRELIGPDNDAIVLRDSHSPLPEGSALEQQHDNHVHGAFVA